MRCTDGGGYDDNDNQVSVPLLALLLNQNICSSDLN
jgi:hypothetical protein